MKRRQPLVRCDWAGTDPLMIAYHDEEWGVPEHDERRLFELLILEGAQAGLSWATVLRRREAYRRAFAGFDPGIVAIFDDADRTRLLADAGIIRNRLKIAAAIANARAFLAVQEEHGGFAPYLWAFAGNAPVQGNRRAATEIPTATAESRALSRDLRRRGFRFVGPVICYALMQAAGLVNDHVRDCFRHDQLADSTGNPRRCI